MKEFNVEMYDLVKQINYCQHTKNDYFDYKKNMITLTYKDSCDLSYLLKNDKEYKKYYAKYSAQLKRKNRLKARINYYFKYFDCQFFTLTFNDDILNNTNHMTRRQYVRRFLKSKSNMYIANIDFGDKTNREHYHGVIVSNDINIFKDWKYGFYKTNLIYNKNPDRLSKYIIKITNHALKQSVRNTYCIYSRDKI